MLKHRGWRQEVHTARGKADCISIWYLETRHTLFMLYGASRPPTHTAHTVYLVWCLETPHMQHTLFILYGASRPPTCSTHCLSCMVPRDPPHAAHTVYLVWCLETPHTCSTHCLSCMVPRDPHTCSTHCLSCMVPRDPPHIEHTLFILYGASRPPTHTACTVYVIMVPRDSTHNYSTHCLCCTVPRDPTHAARLHVLQFVQFRSSSQFRHAAAIIMHTGCAQVHLVNSIMLIKKFCNKKGT